MFASTARRSTSSSSNSRKMGITGGAPATMGGDLARRAPQTCIEALGDFGLSADHLVEKWFRDARIFANYEGTGEIQRLIIAHDLLGYTPKELS